MITTFFNFSKDFFQRNFLYNLFWEVDPVLLEYLPLVMMGMLVYFSIYSYTMIDVIAKEPLKYQVKKTVKIGFISIICLSMTIYQYELYLLFLAFQNVFLDIFSNLYKGIL
ncbi:hypothetical protein EV697_101211 [Bisgaardia hudsonensis]|uniref:Uncharacterized protein n=1 Tax=Bisgaardia hudsonensis TaxID=109472 RepID=A0A4R2N2I8_9PAST|nr:hypothetical protein A6A11_02450 [Bisgaardia hudsonensis]TCP14083.1 hypothetical protein EV697_101211 [Bisgaardia hudsonensis]